VRTLAATFNADSYRLHKRFKAFSDKTSGWKPQIKTLGDWLLNGKDDENIGHLCYAIRKAARITNNSFWLSGRDNCRSLGKSYCVGLVCSKGQKVEVENLQITPAFFLSSNLFRFPSNIISKRSNSEKVASKAAKLDKLNTNGGSL
jgi:hypothetical protein